MGSRACLAIINNIRPRAKSGLRDFMYRGHRTPYGPQRVVVGENKVPHARPFFSESLQSSAARLVFAQIILAKAWCAREVLSLQVACQVFVAEYRRSTS